MGGMAAEVIGREGEVASLQAFLAGESGHRAMVIEGEPGIGKTTLWEAALEFAGTTGFTVLAARASQAEATMSFAALADLLDGVEPETVAALPPPQRHALDVALRRAEPSGSAPDRLAIAAGFLGIVRQLADVGPVLIAVDDLHWLDPASSGPLAYTARRLPGPHTRLLLSKRPGPQVGIEKEIRPAELTDLVIRPLSFGAVNRLLMHRLGPVLPRRLVSQVHQIAQGNALFSLELGRMLIDAGAAGGAVNIDIESLPGLVEDAFRERIGALSEPVGRALLATALSAGLSRPELVQLVGGASVDQAVAAELIVFDRGGARPSHPLLAVAARQQASPAARAGLHLALAGTLQDRLLRTRHRALASDGPDPALAAEVADAARHAIEVGAVHEGEQLAANALRLTPRDDPAWPDRILDLARYQLLSGNEMGMVDSLERHLGDLPPGRPRALAHLVWAEQSDFAGEAWHLEQARAEAPSDPGIRATVLARQAMMAMVNRVDDVAQGAAWAEEAWKARGETDGEVDAILATAFAWARILRGRPIGDLVRHWRRQAGSPQYEQVIERPVAIRHAFRGEVGLASKIMERLHQQAVDRGDYRSVLVFDVQRAEFALRTGDVGAAATIIRDMDRLPEAEVTRARLLAVRAAVAGQPAEARRLAAEVLSQVEPGECPGWDRLEAHRALGLASILEQAPDAAAAHLRSVWEHTRTEGIGDPGAFPVAPDLIEALLSDGDTKAADSIVAELERLSARSHHPWGLATVARGRATLALALAYTDAAVGELEEAAAAYEGLGLVFDQARTLLHPGRVQRRARKRGLARRTLEEAAGIFETLGCEGWAASARSDLDRVSGRRPTASRQLTASERRVVELAAKGMSNKEIAAQLYVGVYTVEAHLSHAYAKLGVRSRAQLARALLDLEAG
jgi:DNA-binding CsgD family transcriptional regulator